MFYANNCKITDNVQTMTVITLVMVIDRTMTATFRAAVLRRIRQDGGSTGETIQINPSMYLYCSVIWLLFYCPSKNWHLNLTLDIA